MRLRLEYPDKYILWSELVKANTDRVFVAVAEPTVKLGARLPIEMMVGGVMLVAMADVVGVRAEGGRFKAGVWVRLDDSEVAKVRRFLGLAEEPVRPTPGRASRREPCNLPVTLTRPAAPQTAKLRNLSESGALMETQALLSAGQRIEFELTLDDGKTVTLSADVARGPEDTYLGLQFVDLGKEAEARLLMQLERLAARPPRARQQLMVADDDPSIREFLSRALSKHGYEVLKASTGREALSLIREARPALVLLDILMPGMDGVDVCKTMRADVELAQIPVIFASALDPVRLHEVADESGATDYLSKPLTLGDLLNIVGKYLK